MFDEQKAVLSESRKQFETENRPFLQATDLKIDTHGKPLHMSYSFFNYGKLPAKVILAEAGVTYSSDKNFDYAHNIPYGRLETNFYISSGVSQRFNTSRTDTLPQLFINYYQAGRIDLYLVGYCKYIDPVTEKRTIYEFAFKLNAKPSFNVTTLKNSVKREKKI